jgi:hypothetical protein
MHSTAAFPSGAQSTQGGVPPQLNAAAQQAVAMMAFQANLERVGAEHTDIFNDRGLTILAADDFDERQRIVMSR